MAGTYGSVMRGGARKDLGKWTTKHAAMLLSAVSGGQWPQMRLWMAKLVDSPLCNLCRVANGTMHHRMCCPRTMPTAEDGTVGWPLLEDNKKWGRVLLTDGEWELMLRQGLMVGRAACNPPTPSDGTLVWHMRPDDAVVEQLT